jgi:hypothetical protein
MYEDFGVGTRIEYRYTEPREEGGYKRFLRKFWGRGKGRVVGGTAYVAPPETGEVPVQVEPAVQEEGIVAAEVEVK